MQSFDWADEVFQKGNNQDRVSCLLALPFIKKNILYLLQTNTWAKVNLPRHRGGTERRPPLQFTAVGKVGEKVGGGQSTELAINIPAGGNS